MSQLLTSSVIFDQDDLKKFWPWIGHHDQVPIWKEITEKNKNYSAQKFIEVFLGNNLTFSQVLKNFSIINSKINSGPFKSWIIWLRERFVLYYFIVKKFTLNKIFEIGEGRISKNELKIIFYNFFSEKLPRKIEQVKSFFQFVDPLNSIFKEINYSEIHKELDLQHEISGISEDDIMNEVEVTLFEDWIDIFVNLQSEVKKKNVWYKTEKQVLEKIVRFFRDFIFICLLSIVVLKFAQWFLNKYELQLLHQIEQFIPDLFKADTKLTFRKATPQTKKAIVEIDDIKKIETKDIADENFFYDRQDPESDVFVTSLDSMPQDFQYAEYEKSNYEELLNVGMRDDVHGQRKVYRILLTTEEAKKFKINLDDLIGKFDGKAVNTVRPGTFVAGGIYYNLYIPVQKLKDFILQVNHLDDEMRLYIARTQRPLPQDKAKVFLWVKVI